MKGSCLHIGASPLGYECHMHPYRGQHFKTVKHHENGNNSYHMQMCPEAINVNHNYILPFHPAQIEPMKAQDTTWIWISDQQIRFSVSMSRVMFGAHWCWRRIHWNSNFAGGKGALKFKLCWLSCTDFIWNLYVSSSRLWKEVKVAITSHVWIVRTWLGLKVARMLDLLQIYEGLTWFLRNRYCGGISPIFLL